MLWWVLGSCLGIAGFMALWLAMEKQAVRGWRRRQRQRLQRYVLANPEAGELQVDGSFCYRRGPHVLRYLHHPDKAAPDHVLWLSVKQRVTEWDRPSHHMRRWVQVVVSSWMVWLWHWQTGVALILLLVLGISVMDAEHGQRYRLEVNAAHVFGVPLSDMHMERGGENQLEELMLPGVRATSSPWPWLSAHWWARRHHTYVLHVRGQDIGYVRHRGKFSDRAEVWLQDKGRWHHGVFDENRVTWDVPLVLPDAAPHDGSSYPAKSLMK